MRIYTSITMTWDGEILEQEAIEYDGPVSLCGDDGGNGGTGSNGSPTGAPDNDAVNAGFDGFGPGQQEADNPGFNGGGYAPGFSETPNGYVTDKNTGKVYGPDGKVHGVPSLGFMDAPGTMTTARGYRSPMGPFGVNPIGLNEEAHPGHAAYRSAMAHSLQSSIDTWNGIPDVIANMLYTDQISPQQYTENMAAWSKGLPGKFGPEVQDALDMNGVRSAIARMNDPVTNALAKVGLADERRTPQSALEDMEAFEDNGYSADPLDNLFSLSPGTKRAIAGLPSSLMGFALKGLGGFFTGIPAAVMDIVGAMGVQPGVGTLQEMGGIVDLAQSTAVTGNAPKGALSTSAPAEGEAQAAGSNQQGGAPMSAGAGGSSPGRSYDFDPFSSASNPLAWYGYAPAAKVALTSYGNGSFSGYGGTGRTTGYGYGS